MTERFGQYALITDLYRILSTPRPAPRCPTREDELAMDQQDSTTAKDGAIALDVADPRLDRAKRRQILEGANRVFLDQGFDAASMGAIAQAASVSKGTLYVYFKSKEELFGAIIEDQRRQQADQLFVADPAEDIEATLIRLGTGFIHFLCRPGVLSSLRTVTAIAHRMPVMGEHFYRTGPAIGVARLKAYLEAQVAAGVLCPHDCEVAAAQLIDSSASLIFKPMLFNAIETPTDAHIDRVVKMAVQTYLRAWRRSPARTA